MYWIYILNLEKKFKYVGETRRLVRRIKEHMNQRGALITQKFDIESVAGIYKLKDLYLFLNYLYFLEKVNFRYIQEIVPSDLSINDIFENYHSKKIENFITEEMKRQSSKPYLIWGGNYCKLEQINKYYFGNSPILPFCHCGILASIKYSYKRKKFYFMCCSSSYEKWDDFVEMIDYCETGYNCGYFEWFDEKKYKGYYISRDSNFEDGFFDLNFFDSIQFSIDNIKITFDDDNFDMELNYCKHSSSFDKITNIDTEFEKLKNIYDSRCKLMKEIRNFKY